MELMNNVNMVIKILNSSYSKSDSEKLASLLLVTKLLKSNELSIEDQFKVFQSINLTFLLKLLKHRSLPSENSSICYKAIGLSILRSFHTIPFENGLIIHEVLPILIEIISSSVKQNLFNINKTENSIIYYQENMSKKEEFPNDNDINSMKDDSINLEDQLVCDTFIIIKLIIESESGKLIVLKSEIPTILINLIATDIYSDEALQTFVLMISFNDHDLLRKKCCLNLVEKLATRLSDIKEKQILKILETLIKIFEYSYFKKLLSSLENDYLWNTILKSIYNIITSKIDFIYCQKALLLSSCIINLFGFIWPVLKNHQSLVLIILHLASIEIKMMLDELHEIQPKGSLELLEGLTTLFIEAIKFVEECKSKKIAASTSKLNIDKIQELIFDCIFSVVHFIKNCNIIYDNLGHELMNPCLCLLSAYISFKEFALDEDIVELVPILVNACSQNFNASSTIKSIGGIASDSDHSEDDNKLSLMHVFLPGFEHLSHLEEVRQVFIEMKFVQVLIDHMKKCSFNHYNEDVNIIVDILYNFVMADQLTDLSDILTFLMQNISNYIENGNMLVLLFSLLSQTPDLNVQELDIKKYISAGIDLLKNRNCENDLRIDLIKNMTKYFSKFPEFTNSIPEADYKHIFIINSDLSLI